MDTGKFIAERMSLMSASGIRRIFDLAATMKNPIDFSMGQPDFPVPQAAKEAAATALRDDCNGYTVTHGLPALRDKIKKQLTAEFDWDPTVFVTCGVSGGLTLAMLSCINPGDEVIIPDPYFVSYPHLVGIAGGKVVPVDTQPDFTYTAEKIEAAITSKTKIILVNSPSNPCGVVYPAKRIKEICEIAKKHDLLIVSDEIYNLLSFDEAPASPVTYAPERCLLLRGFGKSYGMTGWRMGLAAGPAEIVCEMAKLQQYTFVCAPHPLQIGSIAALDTDMTEVVNSYRTKRDIGAEILGPAFDFPKPGGGFFLYCKAPERFASATAFVEAAIKKNVLTVPGSAFSRHDTHFRISYAVPNDKLRRGCELLCEVAKD